MAGSPSTASSNANDGVAIQGAAGLRVLEVSSGLAGAYAGLILAGQGADVTLFEEGERRLDAYEVAYFDRGKTVAPRDARLADLVAASDVVVVDGTRARIASLGLPTSETDVPAGKTFVLVTPFGLTGPSADYVMEDITLWAAGGLAYVTRKDGSDGSLDDERPRHAPQRQPELLAGIAAATAAVLGALEGDNGVLADVSMHEVMAAMLHQHLPPYVWSSLVHGRPESRQRIGVLLPAADGDWYVRPYHVMGLLELIGQEAMRDEPWTKTPEGLQQNADMLAALITAWSVEHPREFVVAEGQRRRTPTAIPRTPMDLLEWEHLQVRGFWDRVVMGDQQATVPTVPVVGRHDLPPRREADEEGER